MWQVLSGSAAYFFTHPNYFAQLVNRIEEANPDVLEEIEKDLHRTLPDKDFPRMVSVRPLTLKPGKVDELRLLLTTYSIRNPDTGYCQGSHLLDP